MYIFCKPCNFFYSLLTFLVYYCFPENKAQFYIHFGNKRPRRPTRKIIKIIIIMPCVVFSPSLPVGNPLCKSTFKILESTPLRYRTKQTVYVFAIQLCHIPSNSTAVHISDPPKLCRGRRALDPPLTAGRRGGEQHEIS